MSAVDPIMQAVRLKMLFRSAAGINKYGVGLDRTDLTRLDWLTHAQEEAMDLAGYLEVLIQDEMAGADEPHVCDFNRSMDGVCFVCGSNEEMKNEQN